MEEKVVLVSEKQLLAIRTFFDDVTEDILYGGAARGGKSEAIGIILAILIASMPGSAWLLSRTQLADLKATTLSTVHSVLKRFGYGNKSYRDKIRDERHIEFVNGSKLFVIQVNLEPGDPEFDRIGSYGYTGGFLDEGQQMSNKVREVLMGRLSELDGVFSTEVPMEYANYTDDQINPGFDVTFKVVGQAVKDESLKTIKDSEVIEEVLDNGKICYITREEKLTIPYKLVESKIQNGKLIHTYAWHYKGCIFTGCNPGTNYTRSEFYRPWKNNELPEHMAFIPAKVVDNPWVDQKYIERLERLPEHSVRKQRLLYGNFDYDDSPGILYDQITIEQMYNREVTDNSGIHYIVVDAARQGKDSTEIGIWEGLHLKKIIKIEKADLVTQAAKIEELMGKYGVRVNNTIVDEVGVGGGLVDMLGCKGFIGNSQPLHPYASKLLSYKKRNYANLRTQAFYYLQKYMSDITITASGDIQELITEELLTVKEKDVDNDSKLQIVPKSLMKEEIGRSPDLADMISMRMWFLIKDHHDGNEPLEDKRQIAEADTEIQHAEWLSFLEEDEEEEYEGPDFDVYD